MIRFDYPESEGIKLKQIQSLVEGWKAFLLDDEQVLFVSDGFYPHYFSKKPRNLFIGKGALGMAVENYIKTLFDSYVNGEKFQGDWNYLIQNNQLIINMAAIPEPSCIALFGGLFAVGAAMYRRRK